MKLNTVLTTNKMLKDEITEMRQNKARRHRVTSKLEKRLKDKQQKMEDVQNELKENKDLIAEIQNDCLQLHEVIEQENNEFDKEWTQGVAQLEREQEILRQEEQKLIATQSKTIICEEWVEDPLVKQYKLSNTILFWDIAKKGNELRKQAELVHEYESALKQMSDQSGITDYKKMIDTIIEFEDANFASVNRISQLTNEITQAESDIASLKKLLSLNEDPNSDVHSKRLKILKGLENEIETYETQSNEYHNNLEEVQATIDSLKRPITRLFENVGCDDELLSKQFSVSGVTDNNMMIIMGIIEQRVLEIAQMHSLCKEGYLEECLKKWKECGYFDIEGIDADNVQDNKLNSNHLNNLSAFKGRQSMINPNPLPLKPPNVPTVSQIEEDAPLEDTPVDIPLHLDKIKDTTEQTINKLQQQQQEKESLSRRSSFTSQNGRFNTGPQLRMKKFLYVSTTSRPQTPRTPKGSGQGRRPHLASIDGDPNVAVHSPLSSQTVSAQNSIELQTKSEDDTVTNISSEELPNQNNIIQEESSKSIEQQPPLETEEGKGGGEEEIVVESAADVKENKVNNKDSCNTEVQGISISPIATPTPEQKPIESN